MQINKFTYILVLLSFVSFSITSAQDPVVVSRLDGNIQFDGMPDEEAWNKIVPLPMTTLQPVAGREPSEKTEILLGYTDDYLWIGGRLYDSDYTLIQSFTKKRDEILANNDYFGILIDCLNNNEDGLFFCTSPSGNRYDNTIFNDARDLIPYNMSWNTYWDVKTTITNKGWFTEMRIPFSSLRFKAVNGKVTMGLLTNRWIPRKNEMIVFPSIDPKLGSWAKRRPSLAHDIVFQDIKPTKPIYITPYVLGGQRMTQNLDNSETKYERSKELTKEAGIDLKYGITSGLTLDLTFNTDFAQVEADDQQVNITRYSLFYPEKRVFFQERADLFNYSFGYMGLNGNIFYSRRIGLYNGEPVRILGGARLTGKIGKFDVGFINMQTAKYGTELASENFNVLRFKRNILNPLSYAGGIFTSRIRPGGNYDYTYGLDTYINTFRDNFFEFKFSQTYSSGLDYKRLADNTFLRINLESTNNNKGWSYRSSFDWLGKEYNPAMGFIQRGNNFIFNDNIRFGWIPGASSFLLFHKVNYKCATYFNTKGLLETIITGPGWEFETKNKTSGSADPEFHREIIRDTFHIDTHTYVPINDYSFFVVNGTFKTSASARFLNESEFQIGQYFDGSVVSIKCKPQWAVSRSIKIEGQYQFNTISFPSRDQKYLSHVVGLKFNYLFNTKLSASTYIQYNSAEKAYVTNVRLRYNPREGNDFYLVFNEGRNTDLMRESPQLPRIENQTLQIKYSHTFTL